MNNSTHCRRPGASLLAAILVVASGLSPSAAASPGASKPKPNIVFIEVDDLCHKYLGCFGNKVVKTPNIDSIASQGVLFRNAVCQGMMCGPSRNSLITGRYPHNLGLYQNRQIGKLPAGTWTLPAALQRSGYFTALVGKSHLRPPTPPGAEARKSKIEQGTIALRRSMGFDYTFHSLGRSMLSKGRKRGQDEYIDSLLDRGLYERYIQGLGKPTTLDEDLEYMDGFFTTTALTWLHSYNTDKPFFLWVNYSCPHGPHDVPQKYHDLYKPQDMPPIIPAQPHGLPEALVPERGKESTGEQILAARLGHAASVTYVDRQVGRMIDGLREKGLLENTVLVFFSDQGSQMGDHGLLGKDTLFKETINPSLIVSWPASFRKGATELRPVELTDLVKMSLDLAEAPAGEKQKPHGYSLLPLLTGNGSYERPGPAFGEIEGLVVAVTERFKYISHERRPVLFDLQADPDELHNVIEQHPAVAADLKAQVGEWLRTTRPVLKAGALRPANVTRRNSPSDAQFSRSEELP